MSSKRNTLISDWALLAMKSVCYEMDGLSKVQYNVPYVPLNSDGTTVGFYFVTVTSTSLVGNTSCIVLSDTSIIFASG